MNNPSQDNSVRQAVEIAINLGLIFIVVAWCLQIMMPFVSLIVWGTVIAVCIYQPFLKLKSKLGGRGKLAVVLVTLMGLTVVIMPSWMFAESIIHGAQTLSQNASDGSFKIKPPAEGVKEWPLVGKKLYAGWSQAASDFEAFLQTHHDQVHSIGGALLAKGASTGLSILQFIISIFIAAALLVNGEAAKTAMQRFSVRLVGDQGEAMLDLSVATVRSVAVGVLGIAFIQALLGGIGMMAVGIPAAGLWALVILVLAVAQLPPLLVLLPMAIYVFSIESTTVAVLFAVWSIVVSFSDTVLKPIFLGRGVEAPMLVILLGAIGGMLLSGIMGLFVGAVVLALGYKLFQAWLNAGEPDQGVENADSGEDTHAPGTP